MTIQELLDKCEYSYKIHDFEKLMGLCDEIRRICKNEDLIGGNTPNT